MAIRFEDIKPKIGSRVVWDDRKDLFTPEAAEAIRRKVEERTVIVFPKLNLTDEEQLQITDLMGGKVKLTGQFNRQENDDNVYQVTLDRKINPQPEYVLGTYFYHMDGMPVEMPPPFATLLSARKVAQKGGQTEFANTYAAWEALPDEEKAELEGLRVVHNLVAGLRGILDPDEINPAKRKMNHEHPLVWTHESGRKSLLIGHHADYIVGMPKPQGRALLNRLLEWAGQPDFSCRHTWQKGDFAMWDNTGALHRALPYSEDSGRRMHRTTVAGYEAVA